MKNAAVLLFIVAWLVSNVRAMAVRGWSYLLTGVLGSAGAVVVCVAVVGHHVRAGVEGAVGLALVGAVSAGRAVGRWRGQVVRRPSAAGDGVERGLPAQV
ncbi:hypothetical protein ABZ901_29600 [Actinacidiphila alni]|uniref:hypothetical protein n=1 Tax=Actinacidiphila alni TaxID=380248 RepID=UPI003411A005